jgi:DNA polymerase-1
MSPQQVIVFWDGGRSKHRMAIYPGYKAGRVSETPTPEEIADRQSYYAQNDAISQALPALGIRSVRVSHVEADDLISIYANMYAGLGRDVVIFTGDKDMHQCASSRVSIFDPQKELQNFQELSLQWVLLDLLDIVRLKAMAGDASDAIDGVPSIGQVRAKQLLPFWDDIFSDTPIPPLGGVAKLIKTAREHREVIKRNEKIIRLPKVWAESFYGLEEATAVQGQLQSVPQRNTAEFIRFCKQWEMTTLLERIDQW